MFDETGRRLRDDSGVRLGVRLVGYRLREGDYERIPANDAGRLPSEALGLEICVKDDLVRFFDPATARYLPTLDEAEARADEAEVRADEAESETAKERSGREAAERREAEALARIEALEAQLATGR